MKYNDGRLIEKRKFKHIKRVIEERFNGVSVHYIKILGEWRDPVTGKMIEDNNLKYEVTVYKEEKKFFLDLKEELKSAFDQKDVYIIKTKVESI